MKITVYVPCHNGEKTLPEVLEALRSQSRKADQYLFVNDRSSDASVDIARKYSFEVRGNRSGSIWPGGGPQCCLGAGAGRHPGRVRCGCGCGTDVPRRSGIAVRQAARHCRIVRLYE